MLDFNHSNLSSRPLCQALNELIERTEPPSENTRHYLGASNIGSECLRRIQYDWWVDPVHPARTRDIFARGHFFAVDGLFRGHADGILLAGPAALELQYPCLWECKCLKAKGWKAIERDGLTKLYEIYAAQVAIYQAYLDVADHPALFTVVNADDASRLHFLVPFDAERAQAWSDRGVMVIEATRAGELLSRITDDPNDCRCKMCSHHERCWRQGEGDSAPATDLRAVDDLSIPDFLRRTPDRDAP